METVETPIQRGRKRLWKEEKEALRAERMTRRVTLGRGLSEARRRGGADVKWRQQFERALAALPSRRWQGLKQT